MAAEPRVSIVIDNYNYARFLADAVESALRQTYPSREVIVVDDGSTDNSRSVIESFGDRITAIFKANGGQASAFNAGLQASQGDIVIFLDADDTLLPTAVEVSVGSFAQPGIVKVQWPLWSMDAQGRRTGGRYPEGPLIQGDLRDQLIRHGPGSFRTETGTAAGPGGAAAWSRSFLAQVMPIPEAVFSNSCDYYLNNLAPIFGRIAAIQEPLGCYRRHGSNDSMRPILDYIRAFLPRHEECCKALSRHLGNSGVEVDPQAWRRNSHYHRVLHAIHEILAVVPSGTAFILIDDNQLQIGGEIEGRRCWPFLEREGQWWGHPADDTAAIGELKRLRRLGAQHLVFGWPDFWYFDHYAGFIEYLSSHFVATGRSEYTAIFDLS